MVPCGYDIFFSEWKQSQSTLNMMAMKATPPKQTLTRMTNAILVMLVERRKE
jgi:hypothetical protein